MNVDSESLNDLSFELSYSTGTTKVKNLDNNVGSLALKLSKEDVKEISDAVPINEVGGHRDYSMLSQYSYKFANTPRNL